MTDKPKSRSCECPQTLSFGSAPQHCLRSSSRNEVENTSLNRLVYQDQFQTLNQELAGHRISKAVYDAELSELEARAVEETEAPLVNYRNRPWIKPASIFLLVLIPFTAVLLYFSWANPSLVTYKGTPEALAAAQPADRIGQLKTFLKESPRAVRAWLALADEYGREGQYKEALNAMNEAFSVSPNGVAKTADYRVQRAVFALETSDPMLRSQAVSDLEQAVKLEPSNIRALELGGIVAYQSGQYAKAAEFWQELLLLTPQDSPAYSRLLDAISDAKNRAQMNFKF